jgi:putative membrane protein
MSSERRLHPLSFLFAIAGQLRQFLFPGLVVIFTAGATSGNWEPWLMVAVIPITLGSLVRSLSYRYRLDETELVVRTGFVFRKERHIPYARIQNIEALQNVVHRLIRVIEVRIETGAGKEDDAIMRVVPVAAYEEIRDCVLAGRPAASTQPGDVVSAEPGGTVIFRLTGRELLLSGFIDNRSAVVIAAAFGLVWEFGMFDSILEIFFDGRVSGGSLVRQTMRAIFGGGVPSVWTVAFTVAAVAALFAGVTVISMAWAYVRLYGFVLRRAGDDLRAEFGLFTRISNTIPLRRIQTLTIFEGPLHRLFKRAAVKVETAGGEGGEQGGTAREPLAPIIRRQDLHQLLNQVLPDVDVAGAAWQPPSPGAARRKFRQSAIVATIFSALFVLMLKWWTLALLGVLLAAAAVHARRYTASLGWATHDGAVLFRRGWLWRRITVARYSKMQIVALHRSPFDRRTGMARLRVDTAGAASEADRIDIPYLPVDVATSLHQRLAAEASGTSFQW